MNSKKSSRYQMARYLVLGLMVGGTVLSLNYTKAPSVHPFANVIVKDTVPPPPPAPPKAPPPPKVEQVTKGVPKPPPPPKVEQVKKTPLKVTKDTVAPGQKGNVLTLRGVDPDKAPLYIVDGSPVESIEGIAPDGIESISVLKNKSATAIYGSRGKNGVILVTTKKNGERLTAPVRDTAGTIRVIGYRTDNNNSAQSLPAGALLVVDGKEVSREEASSISASSIKSVNVYKGSKATIYKGKTHPEGVVMITTKGEGNAMRVDSDTIIVK